MPHDPSRPAMKARPVIVDTRAWSSDEFRYTLDDLRQKSREELFVLKDASDRAIAEIRLQLDDHWAGVTIRSPQWVSSATYARKRYGQFSQYLQEALSEKRRQATSENVAASETRNQAFIKAVQAELRARYGGDVAHDIFIAARKRTETP
jgi:hypothetical protein